MRMQREKHRVRCGEGNIRGRGRKRKEGDSGIANPGGDRPVSLFVDNRATSSLTNRTRPEITRSGVTIPLNPASGLSSPGRSPVWISGVDDDSAISQKNQVPQTNGCSASPALRGRRMERHKRGNTSDATLIQPPDDETAAKASSSGSGLRPIERPSLRASNQSTNK